MSVEETKVAESSAAEVVEQQEPVAVEDFNDAQRDEWLRTGEMPAKEKPKGAESAPAKVDEKTTEKSTEEAETLTPEIEEVELKNYGAKAQKRIKQLLARAKKAEEILATAERTREKPAEIKTEKESMVTEEDGKPKKLPYSPRPQLKDFPNQEAYEDKLFAWRDECKALDAAFNEATQKWEKTERDIKEKLLAGLERVNKKYPDNLEVVKPLFQKLVAERANLPEVTWFLNTTEVLPDLLYAFGGDFKFDEFLALAKSNPAKAVRMLSSMEADIIAAIGKTAKVEESPKKKLVSEAPPPPKEVGGKGVAAGDEEEAALKAGDGDRYRELANKREIAERKAGRRH